MAFRLETEGRIPDAVWASLPNCSVSNTSTLMPPVKQSKNREEEQGYYGLGDTVTHFANLRAATALRG